jgi:hypothetical protein
MNRKSGILGAGIGTIVSTLMIFGILALFTTIALFFNAVDKDSNLRLDRPFDTSSTDITKEDGYKAGQSITKYDTFGILSSYTRKSMIRELDELLINEAKFLEEERSLLAAMKISNASTEKEFAQYIRDLRNKPEYLEMNTSFNLVCWNRFCDKEGSKNGIIIKWQNNLDGKKPQHVTINLSKGNIILSRNILNQKSQNPNIEWRYDLQI